MFLLTQFYKVFFSDIDILYSIIMILFSTLKSLFMEHVVGKFTIGRVIAKKTLNLDKQT